MAQNIESEYCLFECNREKLNSSLLSPIKNYSRIRYTCFDVCHRYFACGSSSGGLYIFERYEDTFRYLYTIPNNEGKLTCISFSDEDENVIAIGTSKGTLLVAQLMVNNQWQYLYTAANFTSSPVDHVIWEENADFKLFVADRNFHVYYVNKVTSLKNLLISPLPTMILKVDSRIVQMDVSGDCLVISTHNRSFVYDTKEASIAQVGSKPRPAGEYGICMFRREVSSGRICRCVYTARPGSRLWECDLQGNVRFTHQFKGNLSKTLPSSVINANCSQPQLPSQSFSPTFQKLLKVSNLMFTYSKEPQSAIFFIDPVRAFVVLWTIVAEDVKEAHCVGNDVFLACRERMNSDNTSSPTFIHLKLLDFEESISRLIANEQYLEAIKCVSNNFISFEHRTHILPTIIDAWLTLEKSEQNSFPEVKRFIDSKSNELVEQQYFGIKTNGDEQVREEVLSSENTSVNGGDDALCYQNINQVTNEAPLEDQATNRLQFLQNKLRISGFKRELKCNDDCGFPKPGSHLQLNDVHFELHALVGKSIADTDADDIGAFLPVCFENGLWKLCLHLLLRCQMFEKYMIYALCLADVSLLNNHYFLDFLNESNSWSLLFQTFDRLQLKCENGKYSSVCLNCGKQYVNSWLKWHQLVDLIFVNKVEFAGKGLHNLLIRSATVEECKIHEQLTQLSDYLQRIERSSTASSVNLNQQENRWAISLKLSDQFCGECKLSLKRSLKTNLIVFKCKHVYHVSCCKFKSHCQLCH